jgi:lactose/L-arabinose transport system substrate-binding protein
VVMQRRIHRSLRLATLFMLLLTLLAGCGGETSTPTPLAVAPTATIAQEVATTGPAETTAAPEATATTATTAPTEATATTGGSATTGVTTTTPSSGADITPDTSLSGKLSIWGWESAVKALQAADGDFKKAYPNIELEYVTRPPADTYQQLQLAASAGTGLPDISVIEDSHLAQFVSLGVLADVSEQVKPYIPQFNQYRWEQATLDGKYYAMPWDSGPVAVFYRRDVFDKAGVDPESIKTWDDYYNAARTIKDKAGVPMWQQAKAQNDARLFEMLIWQRGLGYVDKDGNVILDKDPKIEEVLNYMGKFWQEGLASDTQPWTDPWYKEQADGTVATVVEAAWMGGFFKSFIAPDATGKWGVFKLPAWQAGDVQSSNDGGSSLAMFDSSQQKDAAWAYTEFHMGRPDQMMAIYEASDFFPGLQTTYSDPAFQEADPYYAGQKVRAFFSEVAEDIPTAGVYTSDYQEMNSLLTPELQKFALGQQSAKDALANAAKAIRDKTTRP